MQDAFKFMAKDGGRNFARMAQAMGGAGMDRMKAMGGGRLPEGGSGEAPMGLPPGLTGAPRAPSNLPGLGGPAPRPASLPGLGGGAPFNPFKKP
jgi:signal recognition particle subunit SRP54